MNHGEGTAAEQAEAAARAAAAAYEADLAMQALRDAETQREALLKQQADEREREAARIRETEQRLADARAQEDAARQEQAKEQAEAQRAAETLRLEAEAARERERIAQEQLADAERDLAQANAERARAEQAARDQDAAAEAQRAAELARQAELQKQADLELAAIRQQQATEQCAVAEEQARVNEQRQAQERAEQAAKLEQARAEVHQAELALKEQQDVAEAERARALQLADANRDVAQAREQAQQRLGALTEQELLQARMNGTLDVTQEELKSLRQQILGSLDPLVEQRAQLAEQKRELDGFGDPVLRQADADRPDEQALEKTEEKKVEVAVATERDAWYETALKEQEHSIDQAAEAGEAIDHTVETLKEGAEHRHAQGADERAEHAQAPDAAAQTHAAEPTIDSGLHNPATTGATQQLGTQTEIPHHDALAAAMAHAAPLDAVPGLMVESALVGMMAVQVGKEAVQHMIDWVDRHFEARQEALAPAVEAPAGTPVKDPEPVAALAPEAATNPPVLDPTAAAATPQVTAPDLGWTAPGLDGPPADAGLRHAAYFQDVPEIDPFSRGGRSTEQQRAEAGLEEWQAFKAEQAALATGIDHARRAGDLDTVQMLEQRRHLEGCDFALATANDVHQIACAMHGDDSVHAVAAKLRAEDWAEKSEAAHNQWAVNAVRSDLYQPLGPDMADDVSAWRQKEQRENAEFETACKAMRTAERDEALAAKQERQDRELCEGFHVPISEPTPSYSYSL